ncbi:MAG: hypothetical protein HBSAPP03_25150 [Phycisphaerae bacterium]|nr:MAG: hypothetical protein HBSAPP03_25150 [Phycisphaerae bacterium]
MKTAAPRTYTNVVLTLIAGLLAINLLGRTTPPMPTSAHAQTAPPEDATGLISAAEQRKAMLAELRGIAARLDKMDASMSRVMNVKVVEMPPVKIQDGAPKP